MNNLQTLDDNLPVIRTKKKIKPTSECGLSPAQNNRPNGNNVNNNSNRKKASGDKQLRLEKTLLRWFRKHSPTVPIDRRILFIKAKRLAKELKVENFTPTDGWLTRWKARHNIVSKLPGEKKSKKQPKTHVETVDLVSDSDHDENQEDDNEDEAYFEWNGEFPLVTAILDEEEDSHRIIINAEGKLVTVEEVEVDKVDECTFPDVSEQDCTTSGEAAVQDYTSFEAADGQDYAFSEAAAVQDHTSSEANVVEDTVAAAAQDCSSSEAAAVQEYTSPEAAATQDYASPEVVAILDDTFSEAAAVQSRKSSDTAVEDYIPASSVAVVQDCKSCEAAVDLYPLQTSASEETVAADPLPTPSFENIVDQIPPPTSEEVLAALAVIQRTLETCCGSSDDFCLYESLKAKIEVLIEKNLHAPGKET